jgi:hypothetical protein
MIFQSSSLARGVQISFYCCHLRFPQEIQTQLGDFTRGVQQRGAFDSETGKYISFRPTMREGTVRLIRTVFDLGYGTRNVRSTPNFW